MVLLWQYRGWALYYQRNGENKLTPVHFVQAVNAGEIARACADKNLIADKVREVRIVAVEKVIKGA
jgi:hypothetical protein